MIHRGVRDDSGAIHPIFGSETFTIRPGEGGKSGDISGDESYPQEMFGRLNYWKGVVFKGYMPMAKTGSHKNQTLCEVFAI